MLSAFFDLLLGVVGFIPASPYMSYIVALAVVVSCWSLLLNGVIKK